MPTTYYPQPSAARWHAFGLTAFLGLLLLYCAAAAHVDRAGGDSRPYAVLGGAALVGGIAAVVGRLRGWQHNRGLLLGWAVASLVVTILVGAVDSDVTRHLPGTITITFVYIGLTSPRWRSLLVLPLGFAAFVVGAGHQPGGVLTTAATAALMWVLVAEVPAWLIAQLDRQSEQMHKAAQTDALTQLLDRSTLGVQLALHAGDSAFVMIDLDSFKQYNDAHGHTAGDELLVGFADALRWAVREQDLVFRTGGDEFLLMLVGADHHQAEQIISALRQRWVDVGGPVEFSAGIAAGVLDPMRTADANMYAIKRARGLGRPG